ncbi:MAG TPA: YceD family protein [Rudaea sp.]
MSSALPDVVDAWRMVHARRSFQGVLPLAAMPRLATSLAAAEGEVAFDLEFDKDATGVPYLRVKANTALPLTCQRTLEPFALPVRIDTKLGLIANEADEAALPPGYEPLLLSDNGLRLADVVEDELILALPVVPMKPGTELGGYAYSSGNDGDGAEEEQARPNPFAQLGNLYKK